MIGNRSNTTSQNQVELSTLKSELIAASTGILGLVLAAVGISINLLQETKVDNWTILTLVVGGLFILTLLIFFVNQLQSSIKTIAIMVDVFNSNMQTFIALMVSIALDTVYLMIWLSFEWLLAQILFSSDIYSYGIEEWMIEWLLLLLAAVAFVLFVVRAIKQAKFFFTQQEGQNKARLN